MNKKIFALTLLSIIDLLLVITNSAFSSDIKWTKIYRGPYQEHAINVQQTPDSGYIVIGLIRRNNKYSIWLIKTDAFGDTLWTNKYGKNNFFWKPLIQPTADDGYIIAGSIPSEEKRLVLAIRTDASGNILWERIYEQEKIIGINQIQQTLDYGFILAGFTYTNDYYTQSGWLIKTDKQGNIQWTQTLTSERGIEPKLILQLEDGGFLIGADWGWSIISLIKINSSGHSLWTKNYSKDIINRVLF